MYHVFFVYDVVDGVEVDMICVATSDIAKAVKEIVATLKSDDRPDQVMIRKVDSCDCDDFIVA